MTTSEQRTDPGRRVRPMRSRPVVRASTSASWLVFLVMAVSPGRATAENCCVNPIASGASCDFKRPHAGFVPPENGCGPQKYPAVSKVGNFVAKFGPADFRPPCNKHDICYGTCLAAKSGCDDDFLHGLRQQCGLAYATPAGGLAGVGPLYQCFLLAQELYLAVQFLGESPYEDGQNAACDCCAAPPCEGGVCQGMTCTCPAAKTLCGGNIPGSCFDTKSDPNHCGLCFRACSSDQTCVNGGCTCPSGEADCGGTCCPAGQCQSGSCAPCPAGQLRCTDGTCHSGSCACTPPCSAGQTCQGGTCAPAPPPPAATNCEGQGKPRGSCSRIPPRNDCVDFLGAYTVNEMKGSCIGGTRSFSPSPCTTAARVGSCLVDLSSPGAPNHCVFIRAYPNETHNDPKAQCDGMGVWTLN